MSSATQIVAQLAPQRSTQYSNLARDLAEAELLASPIGSTLQDVALRKIAGQDYVQFSLQGPITDETARLLASMAMLGGVFETFDSIGDVSGPLLRPVPATHPAFISPDMAATRRYKGKTNEAFTHFLCNIAKYASDFAREEWAALDVVDPLCGGGTTLFTALSLGADVAGLDADRTDVESTAAFITQYCRENRIALATKEERLRKLGARRWLFQIGRDDVRRCMLALGDAGRTLELLQGFGRPHLIVTDLPYGIQHSGPAARPARRLPSRLGRTAGIRRRHCLLVGFDPARSAGDDRARRQGRRPRGRQPAALRSPGHRVDRVIKRRDVLVARRRQSVAH